MIQDVGHHRGIVFEKTEGMGSGLVSEGANEAHWTGGKSRWFCHSRTCWKYDV